MKRKFTVTVDVPRGVTLSEMEEYIEDAVATMKGSHSPDDPLFDLNGDSVKVKAVPVKRTVKAPF